MVSWVTLGISPQAVNPLMIRDNNIIFGQDPSQNIAYYATTRPNPNLKWGNLNKPTLV